MSSVTKMGKNIYGPLTDHCFLVGHAAVSKAALFYTFCVSLFSPPPPSKPCLDYFLGFRSAQIGDF